MTLSRRVSCSANGLAPLSRATISTPRSDSCAMSGASNTGPSRICGTARSVYKTGIRHRSAARELGPVSQVNMPWTRSTQGLR